MNEPIYELTDSQWQLIEKIVDDQRQRWHSLRTIVNAIFSINRTGVQWRELDSKYPPWQTVYYHFRPFKLRGIWPGRRRGAITGQCSGQGTSSSETGGNPQLVSH